jgi:hypothetical protein
MTVAFDLFCDVVRREVEAAQARSPAVKLDLDREQWRAVWCRDRNAGRTLWPGFRDLTCAELMDRWPLALKRYAFGCSHLRDAIELPRFVEVASGASKRVHLHVTAYVPRLDLAARGARWDAAAGVWLRCTRSVAQRPHREYSLQELLACGVPFLWMPDEPW